jgi:lysophospholipase L1-like esterase
MAKSKRAIAKSAAIGKTLAAEALRAREPAARSRRAAIKAFPKQKAAKSASAAVRARSSVGTLIAEGDSWFDYPFNDVLKDLEDDYGYDVESVAHAGDRVEDMAYSGGQLDALIRQIEKILRRGDRPRAILLSGGGNDIAGEFEFGMLLNHAASGASGLNSQVADGVINQRLYDAYATILSAITKVCESTLGTKVPIVIHGYDYAVPDGRGFMGGMWRLPGPWLEPGLRQKGYMAMADRKRLVKELIDRFNAMLRTLASNPSFAHVKYVDLRNTLASANYKQDWANELHPTKSGFSKVAAKFAAAI